ncbi:MAG: serine--tRNA ligase, partial [Saprospiraceae bacterium]
HLLTGWKKRGDKFGAAQIDQVVELDDRRKELQTQIDDFNAERNRLSEQVGDLFKQGKRDEATQYRDRVGEIKQQLPTLQDELSAVEAELENLLYTLPNVPHPSVPAGASAEDNEVYRAWDKPLPQLPEGAKPHWELAETYDLFSLELGVKISGAGFPVMRGPGARLQRGLINFFLDRAIEAGYEEIAPPLLVNEASAFGTGQLPDKDGQMYHATVDDLYLIPTAEVPITNILRDEILEESDFPVKMCGYTPCFRREAGSYGAHVRGLNRVHQFDKVELVQAAHPDTSYDTLNEMVDHVAALLDTLELPYRILRLCGGDMGFTSALTYDFEVWSAAQERWLEVSSVSNFETFQSNRMKLRYRQKEEKQTRLAHTLNGSALALPRIMAALLENNQTPEGIVIPKALHSYVGMASISPR